MNDLDYMGYKLAKDLSKNWHMKNETYGERGGNAFVLKWKYPFSLQLSGGRAIVVNSYLEHHRIVKDACHYFLQTGRKSPYVV